ncbi:MAG TPA: glycosyltransferase [Arcobacter sp.]|nr:glycosyltransferase [Arcobacter sp.]
MMKNEFVSIIIPTHNREDLLPRAVESVLTQTYKNIEIIIVDDGSKDNTEELVQNYMNKHENIKYIKHEKALGGNAARNSGIRAASGEFVAGLDDDDEFTPDRIEKLMNNYSDEYSMITSRSLKVTKTNQRKTRFKAEIDLNDILYSNIIGNQVLVKKSVIMEAGLYDEQLLRSQDYDMWVRIIEKFGKAKMMRDVTQIIHYEHDNHSPNYRWNSFKGGFAFYKKHKYLFNRGQRKRQLYGILRLQERKVSIRKLRIFMSPGTIKPIMKYILLGV